MNVMQTLQQHIMNVTSPMREAVTTVDAWIDEHDCTEFDEAIRRDSERFEPLNFNRTVSV